MACKAYTDAEEEQKGGGDSMSLKLDSLSKRFGKKNLFEGLSLSFSETGIFAVVGESGIGKTTLLRMIAGLDNDYLGVISGGGIGRVSVAFQEYRLFKQLSALDNLIYAISDIKNEAVSEKCKKMLLSLGFNENDLYLLPDELSGGMKQRVSLARAFLFDAPILLLDEPTKELDPSNADTVRKIIKEQSLTRLVILVSHNGEDIDKLGATKINLH